MIHLLMLAAAMLHLQDPAGDAVGDGSLVPPTAPVYANTSDFDLQGVTVTDAKDLTVRVTMGALSNTGGLPNGFSNPVIEVYLDTTSGGAQALLPGSTMTMPANHGWNIALRVDGDEAFAVEAQSEGSPSTWPRLPVTVQLQGTTIVLSSAVPRPDHVGIYALVGVYDPFRQDAWRPLSTTPSPWAYSSASQRVPVVDVLASGHGAQRRALDSGVLVPYRSPMPGVGWLVLIAFGLVVAAGGVFLRRRVRAPLTSSGTATGEAPIVPGYERFLDDAEEARLWPDADPSVERAAADHEADATERGDHEADDESATDRTLEAAEAEAEVEADDESATERTLKAAEAEAEVEADDATVAAEVNDRPEGTTDDEGTLPR